MQSKPKANSVITSTYDEERNIITFTVLGAGDIPFDLNKVAASNMARAAVHGFNQRIPDAAAISLTDDDGNIVPKEERTALKFERMAALVAHYETGTAEWSRKGTAGGTKRSLTIEALARVKDETYESAVERVDEYADRKHGGDRKKALAVLAGTDDIKAMMRTIRDERTKPLAGVNADDLLNGEA